MIIEIMCTYRQAGTLGPLDANVPVTGHRNEMTMSLCICEIVQHTVAGIILGPSLVVAIFVYKRVSSRWIDNNKSVKRHC